MGIMKSALAAIAGALSSMGPEVNLNRIYGPRVYTNKNIGKHYGIKWRLFYKSVTWISRHGKGTMMVGHRLYPVTAKGRQYSYSSERQDTRAWRKADREITNFIHKELPCVEGRGTCPYCETALVATQTTANME